MSTPQTLRAFLTICPAPAQCAELQQQLNRLKQTLTSPALRWVPQQNWHITLKFMGNIELQSIPPLTRTLEKELRQQVAFQLTLTHFGWFPPTAESAVKKTGKSIHKPRILAALVAPCDSLNRLAASLDKALIQYGVSPEKRTFRPHLSLARSHTTTPPADCDLLPAAIDPIIIQVKEIELLQSEPQKGSADYSKLAYLPLLT